MSLLVPFFMCVQPAAFAQMFARGQRLLSCALIGSVLIPLAVFAATEIITDTPPPPDRVEHAPPPRDGYVWSAGHWEWNGQAYRWISGSWIVEHGKARWVADQWEPMGNQWRYVQGHWQR